MVFGFNLFMFLFVLQISDIHQFYTRNNEVHGEDAESVMSSISGTCKLRISFFNHLSFFVSFCTIFRFFI